MKVYWQNDDGVTGQPARLTSLDFQIRDLGVSCVFQSTTDLVNWVSLSTNVAPSNITIFVDSSSSNSPARFYRAKIPMPNSGIEDEDEHPTPKPESSENENENEDEGNENEHEPRRFDL